VSSVLRSLTDLRAGVSDAADVTVGASGGRHTNALVDARINRAVTKWARMLAECGDDTYMLDVSVNTSATSPANQLIDVGTEFMYIRGITITDGGVPFEMHPMSFHERHDLSWNGESQTGRPRFYLLGPSNYPLLSADSIRIFPYADAVYSCTVTYIPPPPVLVNGADTVEVIAGGDEWIMNEAARSTLRTDGMADSPAYAALTAENARIEKEMRFTLGMRNPLVKVDTRTQRSMARWRW
jgi:hypothetical protein